MNSYLQAFNALPFPCLLLEPSKEGFVIIDANERYCQLSGKEKHELTEKLYPEIFTNEEPSKESFEKRKKSLKAAFESGTPNRIRSMRLDISSTKKNRQEVSFWNVENIPILDESGKVVQVLNLATDQTAEVNEKQEKAMESGKLQHFIDKNKDGLYSLDTDGNFTSVNEGLCKLAEVPRDELLTTSFLPFCAPHDQERIVEHFTKALRGEPQIFEADFISAKGTDLVLEISLVPIRVDGKISGVHGIARNFTLLREKERELSRSQKKFQAMIQEGSEIIGILGPEGNYKFLSETVENVLGIKPASLIGKNAFELIHSEDKDRVMKDFSVLDHEKQVKVKPFRFKDAAGNWRWLETQATNLLDDPYVEGVVINSREVTELVEQSRQIKQLYERYTLAAEATEDLIYDWNLVTDEVIRFHKSTDKFFGYTRKEIDDRAFWKSHIHPEELPELKKQLRESLQDPNQHHLRTQYRFEKADGTYAQIIDRANIIRNDKGEAIRLIGATSDVSQLMNNKNALKLANKRFSYAMKATKEMIWDWDIEKGHIKRSSSFKKIFGYNTPKFSSVHNFWFEKIVKEDRGRVEDSLNAALKNPEVRKWKEEYCFLRSDGQKAFVIDRGYILRDRQGKATRMVGAVLDVTESRRMLREIKKQNKVLREVAWEQAHIVRAPLARLKGLLDLLEEESYEEWSREELVRLIRSSAEEVDSVIGKIIKKTEKIGSQ